MDIARRVCVCVCVCMFEGDFCVLPRPVAMLDQVHGGCDAGSPNSELCQISRDICLNSDVRQILRHNIWSLLVLNIYPSLGAVDVEDTF